MKIGIAGIGGIGSNVARHLVQAGILCLKVVDFDQVEASNLNRQFYQMSQVGLKKCDALKKNLQQINPRVLIETVERKLTPGESTEMFADCIMVVEGFDDKLMKKQLVEEMAVAGKAVVSASGIAGYSLDTLATRVVGNTQIVGDFVSDQDDEPLFPPKIAIVAATMAGLVLPPY